MSDQNEILADFVVEAREHLSNIETELLAIEEGGDNASPDLVNKVFRSIHSVKGAAGFLGLSVLNELAHNAENVLNRVRNKQLSPTHEVIDILLRASDELLNLINNIDTSNEQDVSSHVQALQRIIDQGAAPAVLASMEQPVDVQDPGSTGGFQLTEHTIKTHKSRGNHLFVIECDLVKDIEAKGKSPLSLIKEINSIGEIVDARLGGWDAQGLDEEIPTEIPFIALIATVLEEEFVREVFPFPAEKIRPITLPSPAAAAPAAPPSSATPAPAKPQAATPPAPAPAAPKAEPPAASAGQPAPSSDKATSAPTSVEATIRVPVSALDKLMNLAGELVLSRNQILQMISTGATDGLASVASRLDQITSDLQEAIMVTRMQQVGTVFSKFPRVVRDLSAKLNKQIELTLEGTDVELDKSIIEAISDPLTHLVRNSVDHGVEMPADRQAAGKPPTGQIVLRAYHEAGKVNIAIKDDGKGIDAAKLKEKAVAKGLITQEEARDMSEREAVLLIFKPGFSMAKEVTDVSGRGVGMDVVKTNLERLGGTFDIQTQVGVGTTIRVKLPLTLAIIPSLVVQDGDDHFAIPQVNIRELVRVSAAETRSRIQRVKNAEVLRLRETLLPLVRLSDVLNPQKNNKKSRQSEQITDCRPTKATPGTNGKAVTALDNTASESEAASHAKAINVVVVDAGGLKYGLVVEALHDSEEIVVKPLGRHMKECTCLAGATILGDGRVAMILDVSGISEYRRLSTTAAAEASAADADRTAAAKTESQSLLLVTNAPTERFGLPMGLIARIERIQREQVDSVGGQELLQYRGGTLPLLSLETCIKAKPRPETQKLFVVVFNINGREIGLITPELLDIREVPMDVDTVTFREPGVAGSLVIDDKTVRLIDIHEIARTKHPTWFEQTAKQRAVTETSKRILFAEDSGFFRNQLVTFLTSNGLDVVPAEDGQEAWETLDADPDGFSLVVTDIEMPNLDGFALCDRIKQDPRTQHLPVIAVTSLAGQQDVDRGKQVGIDEHQVKLDKDKLLAAIHRFLKTSGAKVASAARV